MGTVTGGTAAKGSDDDKITMMLGSYSYSGQIIISPSPMENTPEEERGGGRWLPHHWITFTYNSGYNDTRQEVPTQQQGTANTPPPLDIKTKVGVG